MGRAEFLNHLFRVFMRLLGVGLLLVFVGFFLVFLAALLATGDAVVRSGAVGCVVVFFVPICFGAGDLGFLTWGLLASAALLAISALFLWLISRGLRAGGGG